MKRRWKPIPGFEDCYSVSDDGVVARTSTYGKQPRPVWKLLAKRQKRGGYITFHLCRDGVRTDPLAHRLVWQAFVGEIPDRMEINHLNGVKSDNRLANLEVCTTSENVKHSYRVLGQEPRNSPSFGEKNGSAKLREADIIQIRAMHHAGKRQQEIAKAFGVTQPLVGMIVRGELWRHIPAAKEP